MKKGYFLDDHLDRRLAELLSQSFDINFAGTLESAVNSIFSGERVDFVITSLPVQESLLEEFCKRKRAILSSIADAGFGHMNYVLTRFLEIENRALKDDYFNNFYQLQRLKENTPNVLRIIYSYASPSVYSLFDTYELADDVLPRLCHLSPEENAERLKESIEKGGSHRFLRQLAANAKTFLK